MVSQQSVRRVSFLLRKKFEEGYGKHLNMQCKQCTREQAKVDATEERVLVGVCRSISTAAKATKEQIVLERDSGPRPEARKEERGKRKVAKVTPEFAGAVGNVDTSRRTASRRVGTGVSERCRRRQR